MLKDIIQYIIEEPLMSFGFLVVGVLALYLAPYSDSMIHSKKNSLINKHYEDTFKKRK